MSIYDSFCTSSFVIKTLQRSNLIFFVKVVVFRFHYHWDFFNAFLALIFLDLWKVLLKFPFVKDVYQSSWILLFRCRFFEYASDNSTMFFAKHSPLDVRPLWPFYLYVLKSKAVSTDKLFAVIGFNRLWFSCVWYISSLNCICFCDFAFNGMR